MTAKLAVRFLIMCALGYAYFYVARLGHRVPADPADWELGEALETLFPLLGAAVAGFIGAQLGVTLSQQPDTTTMFVSRLGRTLGAEGGKTANVVGFLLVVFVLEFIVVGFWSARLWIDHPDTVPQAIRANALLLASLLSAVAAGWKTS